MKALGSRHKQLNSNSPFQPCRFYGLLKVGNIVHKYQLYIIFLCSCVLKNGSVSQPISHFYIIIYSVFSSLSEPFYASMSSFFCLFWGKMYLFIMYKFWGVTSFACFNLPPMGMFAYFINCNCNASLSYLPSE